MILPLAGSRTKKKQKKQKRAWVKMNTNEKSTKPSPNVRHTRYDSHVRPRQRATRSKGFMLGRSSRCINAYIGPAAFAAPEFQLRIPKCGQRRSSALFLKQVASDGFWVLKRATKELQRKYILFPIWPEIRNILDPLACGQPSRCRQAGRRF